MENRRKVITKIYSSKDKEVKEITCYFNKTFLKNYLSYGCGHSEILAELETMEGRLLYVPAIDIKFID